MPKHTGPGEYLYAVTARKPSAVSLAVKANFTSAQEKNLLLAKHNFLSLFTVTEGGLVHVEEINIYAVAIDLTVVKLPKNAAGIRQPDKILLLKESSTRSITFLSFRDGRISVGASIAIDRDVPSIGLSAFICRYHRGSQTIGLHSSRGLIKFFRTGYDGTLTHFNRQPQQRMNELNVIDFSFYVAPQVIRGLCIALLHRVHGGRTFVTSHPIQDMGHVISRVPIHHRATLLSAVRHPVGGFVVLGGTSVSYVDPVMPKRSKVKPVPELVAITCVAGPKRGTFFVGDQNGDLFVVKIIVATSDSSSSSSSASTSSHTTTSKQDTNTQVLPTIEAISVQKIGVVSSPSCLVSFGAGMLFVGSEWGNSQLLQLQTAVVGGNNDNAIGSVQVQQEKKPDTTAGLTVLQEFVNIGPMVDFCVVDMERHGQCRMIACTGAYRDGALSFIQNGILLEEEAVIPVVGMNNVWGLRSCQDKFHSLLVQSFTGETRVMRIQEDEMSEVTQEFAQLFDTRSRTVYCGNIEVNGTSLCVQITPTALHLVIVPTTSSDITLSSRVRWTPTEANSDTEKKITHAICAGEYVLVVVGASELRLLKVNSLDPSNNNAMQHNDNADRDALRFMVEVVTSRTLDFEISSINFAELGLQVGTVVFIGTWTDNALHVLHVPDLHEIFEQGIRSQMGSQQDGASSAITSATPQAQRSVAVSTSLVPRDILVVQFMKTHLPYVFVGLRNGGLAVFEMRIEKSTVSLGPAKIIMIGSTPLSLTLISTGSDAGKTPTSNVGMKVLIACDRTTIVSYSNGRLVYSAVNIQRDSGDDEESEDESDAHAATVSHLRLGLSNPILHSANVFNAEDFPNSIVYITADSMCIGSLDQSQSQLQVNKRPLMEQPYRITHLPNHQAVAVGTMRHNADFEQSSIRVFGDRTGEELACYKLDKLETVCALTTIHFQGRDMVVVGTAYQPQDHAEPSVGRIIILSMHQQKATKASENIDLKSKDTPIASASSNMTTSTTGEMKNAATVHEDATCDLPWYLVIEGQILTKGAVFCVKVFEDGNHSTVGASSSIAAMHKSSTQASHASIRQTVFLAAGVNEAVVLVAVGVNSSVTSMNAGQSHLEDGNDLPLFMRVQSQHAGGVLSLFVDVPPSGRGPASIVVGDAKKSVRVLSYVNILEALALMAKGHTLTAKDSISGMTSKPQLTEVGRDFDAANMTALKCISATVFICADDMGNFYTVRRRGNNLNQINDHVANDSNDNTGTSIAEGLSNGQGKASALTDEERFRLERFGCFHWGGVINRINAGSLVMQSMIASKALQEKEDANILTSSSWSENHPQFLFGTSNGTVGVITSIARSTYVRLFYLMRAMQETVFRPSGAIAIDGHEQWRGFRDTGGMVSARRFIDGDFVQTFPSLPRSQRSKILKELNIQRMNGKPEGAPKHEIKEAEMIELVEQMARLTH